MTGTIKMGSKGVNKQVLDKLKVERDRGITGQSQQIASFASQLRKSSVKAQTARLTMALIFLSVR
jgi:translation elongation factor EF-4